ncbi:hypothetical protein [Streptomyces macrosporus]|uniref:hypothetical protein n=1 Tax=Streptomyces macrosporus TaxID=44032 RepID=UPI0031D1B07F
MRAAADAGWRVWSGWDPALRDRSYRGEVARHAERLPLTDPDDETGLRDLVARIAHEHRIAHVMHLGDARAMASVLAEAEALGLGANPGHAVCHDQAHPAQGLEVVEGGVGHAQEVGVVAGAEQAGVVGDAEGLGGLVRGRVDDLGRRSRWGSGRGGGRTSGWRRGRRRRLGCCPRPPR